MKTDFENHLKLHGKQNQFHCPLCNHSYQTSTKLWNHLSKAHFAKSEGFQCSLCDNKAFKHAFNYHLHMLIHLEEQPEKCRFCAKTFRTKPSLRKHELIHTGQKPFHCPECNSKFKTKDELKQHSISHTTGKPHKCQFCSMSFKYNASLKRHVKKGRCKIGKHWCPTQKRSRKGNESSDKKENCISEDFSQNPKPKDDQVPNPQPLFCDVFLGSWEKSSICALNSTSHFKSSPSSPLPLNSSFSLPLEPIFSFWFAVHFMLSMFSRKKSEKVCADFHLKFAHLSKWKLDSIFFFISSNPMAKS